MGDRERRRAGVGLERGRRTAACHHDVVEQGNAYPVTGEYTRLTRFLPGADTAEFGGNSHPYPEEVFIVSGRLYDQAFDLWLEAGHYASRPPGELHGPFRTDTGCVVLEVSFPNRIDFT